MSRDVSMLPEYSTETFTDIWSSYTGFKNEFTSSPFKNVITDDSVQLTFYLLYARYGNNPIANLDVNQWKFKIFSVMFQYGPTWEKRLDVQKKLRELSDDDLLKGSDAIYNHAFNPSAAPSTQTLTELPYINDQNTSKFRRSKLDAYNLLIELLDTDVTEEYLDKFKHCFKQFVRNERPLLFVTDTEEED